MTFSKFGEQLQTSRIPAWEIYGRVSQPLGAFQCMAPDFFLGGGIKTRSDALEAISQRMLDFMNR